VRSGLGATAPRLAGARWDRYITAATRRRPTAFRAGAFMRAILDVILLVLNLYIYVLIASVIFSWLYAFNVVNPRNQIVGTIGNALYALTEPVLRPIRNRLPQLGGLDLSPIVVFLAIFLIQRVIEIYLYPSVF
jgi:YggT family protein